jgi:hypothetical protein
MSVKHHENIRVQVAQLLKDILKNVATEKYRIDRDSRSYMLLKLLESPEEIVTLMPQEVYVAGERKAIDMALGSKIIFEFKSSESEFDEAEHDATTKYWSTISKADFFIVTNWNKWRIYEVKAPEVKLKIMEECDRQKAEKLLKTQVIPRLREIKIPPLPQNVEALYKLDHEKLLGNLKKVFEAVRDDSRVKPLYDAYKSIMSMLYGEAEEEFFRDLFIRHTYMHMAVLASLAATLNISTKDCEVICSGSFLEIDIALPYLNWWKMALYNDALRSLLEETLESIVERANLIDWSFSLAEDVFRLLYEFLIEPKTRRRIGEYYTPLWLVEMIINEFDVKGKIILDPFCGSGTFLVKAFHKKVELEESPDDALNEVVGFDINPLAVAVARAELIMAYWRKVNKVPGTPPRIYHIDTLAMWFGGTILPTPGLKELVEKAKAHIQTQVSFNQIKFEKSSEILTALKKLENSLTYSIRFAYNKCKLNVECLGKEIERYLEEYLKNDKDSLIQSFLKHFKDASISSLIANVVALHGGNDVWSVVLVSIYATILMTRFKPDIIVTNPPWIPATEYRAPYADRLREYMSRKIRGIVSKKAEQVLTGADIASTALGKSVELAREGVAYIMNREQLFWHKSPIPAGITATYSILRDALKNSNVRIKLFDFDFDVFKHGIYPAIIVVKKINNMKKG